MYTEYVFENKKYEVACREIKATLFDIVTTEEEKIAQLREKAFVDANDPRQAAELQNLYVQQDACLREILSISEKLTKSMQRVDACSRKLKQIEDKNVAQIIANIKDINESQQMMSGQPSQMAGQDYGQPVMVSSEEYSGAADVAMAPEPVDEPVMDPNATEVVHDIIDAAPTTPPEEAKEDVIHEIIDVAPTTPPEEKKEDVIHEIIDVAPTTPPEEPSITATSEVGGIEIPVVTATETPAVDTTASAIPAIVTETTDAPVMTATETPVVESTEGVIIPTINAPSEVTSSEVAASPSETLIIPSADSATETPTVDTTETANIQPVVSTADASVATETNIPASEPAAEPATEPTEELGAIPVITISSDGPLEAVGGGSLEETQSSTGDNTVVGIPEMIPGVGATTNVSTATVSEPVTVPEVLTFKKRTSDPPKVIMISGKQALKLRQSMSTQEALLSAKGYFKAGATTSDVSLEHQLVSNGLLAPDVATKQAQIEQMMNQANQLYAAGKVEEAQNMYNQISALNRELQLESAGNVK